MLHFHSVKIGDKGQEIKSPQRGDCERDVWTTQSQPRPGSEFYTHVYMEVVFLREDEKIGVVL